MIAKVLKILLVFSLSALFATAFMESNELPDGIFTAKTFYFYLISAIAVTILALKLFIKKPLAISLNKLDIALLLFYCYSVVRLIFTDYVPLYNERIVCFTFLIIFYFVFKNIFKQETFRTVLGRKSYAVYFLTFAFLTAGLLQGLIGLFQTYQVFGFWHSIFLTAGSFGNPAPYSGFITSIIPFSLGLSQLIKTNDLIDKILKKYSSLTFFVCLLVLPLTKTRGAWVAALGGILFVLSIKYNLVQKLKLILNRKLKKIVVVISTIAITFVLLFGLYNIRPSSAFGRLLIWKISTNILCDYPLFGIGYNSFGKYYPDYQASYFAETERSDTEKLVVSDIKHSHNDYIETTVELGFVGLLLLLFIFYNVFWHSEERSDKESPSEGEHRTLMWDSSPQKTGLRIMGAAQASILAVMISSFFTYTMQILPTLFNMFFLFGIISSYNRNTFEKVVNEKEKLILPLRTDYLCIILFIPLIIFIDKEIRNYKAYIKWNTALVNSYVSDYNNANKMYAELYPQLKTNPAFLLNYGGTLSLANQHEQAINILEEGKNINTETNLYIVLGRSYNALKKYSKAEEAFTKATNINPLLFYPRYLLVKLYAETGKNDDAIKLGKKIMSKKIKIPSSAINEMKNEIGRIISLLEKKDK